MKNLLALAAITAMITVACSEDPVTPTADKTYVPSAVGSYVIHNNTSIFSDDETFDDGTDSTVVVATMSMTDSKGTTKNAIVHYVYVPGFDEPTDTIVMAQEGGKIYTLFDLELAAGDQFPPVDLGTRWLLIGDASSTSPWTALEETITGVQFEYPGVPVPLTANVQFKMTCTKQADTTMTLNSAVVATAKYNNKLDISIAIAGFPNPIAVSLATNEYYGENVGLVRSSQDAGTIETPFGPLKADGYNSVAVRYGKK